MTTPEYGLASFRMTTTGTLSATWLHRATVVVGKQHHSGPKPRIQDEYVEAFHHQLADLGI